MFSWVGVPFFSFNLPLAIILGPNGEEKEVLKSIFPVQKNDLCGGHGNEINVFFFGGMFFQPKRFGERRSEIEAFEQKHQGLLDLRRSLFDIASKANFSTKVLCK